MSDVYGFTRKVSNKLWHHFYASPECIVQCKNMLNLSTDMYRIITTKNKVWWDSYMKRVRLLFEKFELSPLWEIKLGVIQALLKLRRYHFKPGKASLPATVQTHFNSSQSGGQTMFFFSPQRETNLSNAKQSYCFVLHVGN